MQSIRTHLRFLPSLMISSLFISMITSCAAPLSSDSDRRDANTLRLLYWQAPTILNPHLSTGFKDLDAARIVYEPLASYDVNDNLVLFLAAEVPTQENGGLSPDGKSVTWKLKPDVRWSDGEPFTAHDVVFTFQLIQNPDVGTTSAQHYSNVDTVEALDDHTVKITFKQPTPNWSTPFTGQNGLILPSHIFAPYNSSKIREAPANQIPIGTGPYQVTEFKPGDIVIYEKNPLYWDQDKPFFQRVELKGGGDATSAARAVLQTGDADYAYNLQVEAPILKQLEAGGKGKVSANFSPYVEQILLNFTDPNKATADGERSSTQFPHPFFTDIKVRQAFSLAIDRETIVNQLYGVSGKVTGQLLVLPKQFKSDKIIPEFNLEKAATLLDEAGWKDTNGNRIRDKNGIEMKVLFQTSVNPLRQKTQEIIKQSLISLGVEVELKSVDAGVFFSGDPANFDTLNHFYADLQMLTTGNTTPDPAPHKKWWTCDEISSKANNWQKSNYSRYCNPAYDRLWQQAVVELDLEKRANLFKQMDELLAQDFAVIPIVDRATTEGISNRLQGVVFSPWDANTWNIKDWQLSQ